MQSSYLKGIEKRPDRPNPTDLFVGREPRDVINDVYVSDLKKIIEANWDVFGTLFDDNKRRFLMNMDAVNKGRRIEAHAKPATKEEIEEFSNSYSWLMARLCKVSVEN